MPVNTTMNKQRNKHNHGRGPRGGSGRHQNSENMRLQGVYANPRFCDTIARLKGCQVSVQVKSEGVYEGVLHTISQKGEIVLNVAHRLDNSSSPGMHTSPVSDDIIDKLVLKPASIVTISAKNVDMEYSTKSFALDSEIGVRVNGQIEKKFEQWMGDGDDDDVAIDDDISFSLKGSSWTAEEMFETNKANFGYQSSYKENLEDYTTPLNEEDTPEFRQRRKRAEQLAREIEQSPEHISREKLENDDELTEEERFSAVVRPGHLSKRHNANSSNENRYVPPHQRSGNQNRNANRKNSPSGPAPSGPGRPSQDRHIQSQPVRQGPQTHPSQQHLHNNQSKGMSHQSHVPNPAISHHRVPVSQHSGPQTQSGPPPHPDQQSHLGHQSNHPTQQPHPGQQPRPGQQPHQGQQQHPGIQAPHPASQTPQSSPQQMPQQHVHPGVHSQPALQQQHSSQVAHPGTQPPPSTPNHPSISPQARHPVTPYSQPVPRLHQHQQSQPTQVHPGPHIQKQTQPQSPPYQSAPQIQRHPVTVDHTEARVPPYPIDNRQQEGLTENQTQRKDALPNLPPGQRSGPRSPSATQPLSPTNESPGERQSSKPRTLPHTTPVIEELKAFRENFQLNIPQGPAAVPEENKVPTTPSSPAAPSTGEKPSGDMPSAPSVSTESDSVPPPATSPTFAAIEKSETEEAEKLERSAEKNEKKVTLNPNAPAFVPSSGKKVPPVQQKTPTPPPSRSPPQLSMTSSVFSAPQQSFVMYPNQYVVQAPQTMVRSTRSQKPTVSNIPRDIPHYPASMAGTPLISPMALQPSPGLGPGISTPFGHQVIPSQVMQSQIPYMYKQGQMYRQMHPAGNPGTTTAVPVQHQQLVPSSDSSAMLNQALAYQQTMVQHQAAPASQNPFSHPSAQQMQHQSHPHAQQHTTPPLSQTPAGHQQQAQQVMGPHGQFSQHGGRPSPGPVPPMPPQVHHVTQQQGGIPHQMMVNTGQLVYTPQLQQPPQPGQQAQHTGQQFNIHPVSHPQFAQNVQVNQSAYVPSNASTNITSVTPVHTHPHPHPQPANVVYVSNNGHSQSTIASQQYHHGGQMVGPFSYNPQAGLPQYQQGN